MMQSLQLDNVTASQNMAFSFYKVCPHFGGRLKPLSHGAAVLLQLYSCIWNGHDFNNTVPREPISKKGTKAACDIRQTQPWDFHQNNVKMLEKKEHFCTF